MRENLGERIRRRMTVGETRKVSSLAKSFRVRVGEVRDCIHDTNGLDLIVGIRCGNGHGLFRESEYEVERFE